MLNEAQLLKLQILQHKTNSAPQGHISFFIFGIFSRQLKVLAPWEHQLAFYWPIHPQVGYKHSLKWHEILWEHGCVAAGVPRFRAEDPGWFGGRAHLLPLAGSVGIMDVC